MFVEHYQVNLTDTILIIILLNSTITRVRVQLMQLYKNLERIIQIELQIIESSVPVLPLNFVASIYNLEREKHVPLQLFDN